jgi:solute carrier family 35 protein F5
MDASYLLGLIFIFLVSVIWSVASILVQYMYQGLNFNSPFLLTYIGTSLFVILIPTRLIWERWHYIQNTLAARFGCMTHAPLCCCFCRCCYSTSIASEGANEALAGAIASETDNVIIPWVRSQNVASNQQSLVEMKENSQIRSNNSWEETIELAPNDGDFVSEETTIPSGSSAVVAIHDQQQQDRVLLCKSPLVIQMEQPTYQVADTDAETATLTLHHSPVTDENERLCYTTTCTTNYIFSHQDHMRMAIKVAPIWFISNYFYNLSLAYTSITSSTVLSSTGSVFTFIFSLTFGDEKFTCWKILGVSLAFFGSIITSFHDASKSQSHDVEQMYQHQLWGDAAGLISAVGYGGYTVLIRSLCPTDESRMSMQLFLGYIGLMNMVLLSPVCLWVLASMSCTGEDEVVSQLQEQGQVNDTMEMDDDCKARRLTAFVLACLITKGLLDNVLSDYLWARAIILTSATVATVGLGLTIPLALLSDIFLMQRDDVFSFGSICGAIFVLFGFVCVNIGVEEEQQSV